MDGLKICPDCGTKHSWRTSNKCFNCHIASQEGPTKPPKILPYPSLDTLKDLGFELINVDETDWDAELRELWAKR